jgi:hypothetical protein
MRRMNGLHRTPHVRRWASHRTTRWQTEWAVFEQTLTNPSVWRVAIWRRSCESTAFGGVFVSSCSHAGKHHRAAVEIIAEGASRRAPG